MSMYVSEWQRDYVGKIRTPTPAKNRTAHQRNEADVLVGLHGQCAVGHLPYESNAIVAMTLSRRTHFVLVEMANQLTMDGASTSPAQLGNETNAHSQGHLSSGGRSQATVLRSRVLGVPIDVIDGSLPRPRSKVPTTGTTPSQVSGSQVFSWCRDTSRMSSLYTDVANILFTPLRYRNQREWHFKKSELHRLRSVNMMTQTSHFRQNPHISLEKWRERMTEWYVNVKTQFQTMDHRSFLPMTQATCSMNSSAL